MVPYRARASPPIKTSQPAGVTRPRVAALAIAKFGVPSFSLCGGWERPVGGSGPPGGATLVDDLRRDRAGGAGNDLVVANRERVGGWRIEDRRPVRRIESRVCRDMLAHVAELGVGDCRGLTVVVQHRDQSANAEIVGPDRAAGLVSLVAKSIEDFDDLAQRMEAGAELGPAARRLAGR